MLLALVLVVAGVVTGLVRGGSLDAITGVRFRHAWLVFVGLGLQVGAEIAAAHIPSIHEGATGPLVLVVSYAFVGAFVLLNLRFPGTVIIGLGLLLNLVVILANGAMPVSLWALKVAGSHAAPTLQHTIKHQAKGAGTRLGFLGDIIPAPPLAIVSVGDVVFSVGLFLLVNHLVVPEPGSGRGPRRRQR